MRVITPVHMSKEDSSLGTLYAYRPVKQVGVNVNANTGAYTEPGFDEIIWNPSPTAVISGHEAYIIQQALVGNSGSAGQGRWGVCYTCREEYPLANMSIIGGRTYCSEFGCAEEAQS